MRPWTDLPLWIRHWIGPQSEPPFICRRAHRRASGVTGRLLTSFALHFINCTEYLGHHSSLPLERGLVGAIRIRIWQYSHCCFCCCCFREDDILEAQFPQRFTGFSAQLISDINKELEGHSLYVYTMYACMLVYSFVCMHVCTSAYTCMYVCTFVQHVCVHAYMHAYVRTYMY